MAGRATASVRKCTAHPTRFVEVATLPPGAALAATADPSTCALLFAGQVSSGNLVTVRRVSADGSMTIRGSIAEAERVTAMVTHQKRVWAAGETAETKAFLASSDDGGGSWRRHRLPAAYTIVEALAVTDDGTLFIGASKAHGSDLLSIPPAATDVRVLIQSPVVIARLGTSGLRVLGAGVGPDYAEAVVVRNVSARPTTSRLPADLSEVRAVGVDETGPLFVGGIHRRPDGVTSPLLFKGADDGANWRRSPLPQGDELIDLAPIGRAQYAIVSGEQGTRVFTRPRDGATWTNLSLSTESPDISVSNLTPGPGSLWAWGNQVLVGTS
jgi:hypothetical protein